MTDQCVNHQTLQEDVRKTNRGSTKYEDRDYHSDVENVAEELQRTRRTTMEPLNRRKPALVRSKTFDNSLLTQDHDSKMERKKSQYSQLSKSNCHYHKIFKEISKEEQLRQSYTCALHKDILYQGRIFVSDHWIGFHSKVFGKDTKIAIPVTSVTNIKKTKTAILVPNALVISTANDRYVFVSLLHRDNTYKFLMSVCPHLEEKSPCSSPIISSAESSFRGQRSPRSARFPLSPGDFRLMEGGARRQEELEESSSSDSQTPDYDKIAEFPVPPFMDVMKTTDAAAGPEHLDHQNQKQNQNQHQNHNQHQPSPVHQQDTHHSDVVIDRKMKPGSITTLLFIYLLLVCVLVFSSCFLALKIISLEQRLTTISSVTDYNLENDFLRMDMNSELFSDLLTINLVKLEKVQKNLQKLLEETAA